MSKAASGKAARLPNVPGARGSNPTPKKVASRKKNEANMPTESYGDLSKKSFFRALEALKQLPHDEGVFVRALKFREGTKLTFLLESRRFIETNRAFVVRKNGQLDLVEIQKPALAQTRLDELFSEAFGAVLESNPHTELADMRPRGRFAPPHRAPSHDPVTLQSEELWMARRIELGEKFANLDQGRRLGHQKIFPLA